MRIYDHPLPIVWDDSPNVRRTDPITSSIAADRAVRRIPTAVAVEAAMQSIGHPATSDVIHQTARQMGYMCTPQRVRTVLAEGGPWGRTDEFGVSEYGNPSQLWALREDKP